MINKLLKLFLIIALIVILSSITIPAYADITIIEVEANPVGPDEGNEWAILFNSGKEQVNLSGWGIASIQGGNSHDLSGNIGTCEQKRVFFSDEFVANELESLVLYDRAGKVVDSTSIINDITNNTATWKTEIPNCEGLQQQNPEPDPVVESISEEANTTEIIEENQKDSSNLVFNFEDNEELKGFTEILPYLGIILALVLVAIFIKNKKGGGHSKNKERDIESEYATLENAPLLKKFQDMQIGQGANDENNTQPKEIIRNKLRIISKLQENKIGDSDRLEAIKKSLETDKVFTKEDVDYLETMYKEYKKTTKKNSDE